MNKKILAGISVFVLSTLACEPVFAIGWKEIAFVFLLFALLIVPPVYKFIRRLEKFRNQKDK